MVRQLTDPRLDFWPGASEGHDDDISAQVWGLLAALYPTNSLCERRRDHRYPFPYLVHLLPVGDDSVTPIGEAVVVAGKHLSSQGIGFYHPQPLQYRRMIASVEAGNGVWVSFLIDLTWCRFTRQRWYESGGKFVQAANPPDCLAKKPA